MRSREGFTSLRAHDVHQGLQAANIDRGSGLVGEELEAAQLVGMAAAVATAIKGMDAVADAGGLKRIANQQYDIPTFAFERVIRLLEEVEFVRRVMRSGDRIDSFYENVPEDFGRLYVQLDRVYEAQSPSEVDQSLLAIVDELALGPRPLEQLEVDPTARDLVLKVGKAAEAIRVVEVDHMPVAYSPYFAYEQPEKMG